MNALLIILLPALIAIESNGKNDAIGDNGKAVGCLQIHMIYLRDVNRIAKTKYKDADRLDRKKSLEMATIYLTHYAKRYSRITGKIPTLEVISRMHNGGLNGWKKEATKKYWLKVKKHLQGKL